MKDTKMVHVFNKMEWRNGRDIDTEELVWGDVRCNTNNHVMDDDLMKNIETHNGIKCQVVETTLSEDICGKCVLFDGGFDYDNDDNCCTRKCGSSYRKDKREVYFVEVM